MSSTPRFGDDQRPGAPETPVSPATPPANSPGRLRLSDRLPPLPTAVLDPRPALALGTAVWLGVAIVLLALGGWSRAVALCLAGIAVGLLGTVVYALQRRAVVRGARGSQQGLDFDRG